MLRHQTDTGKGLTRASTIEPIQSEAGGQGCLQEKEMKRIRHSRCRRWPLFPSFRHSRRRIACKRNVHLQA
jgi:hypothetical protein